MTNEELIAKSLSEPAGYAKVKLEMELHDKQKKVIESIFKDKRVVFRCGNGVGKTSVVITGAILYALEILGCQIVSTSATYRQITSQLIPCLKKYAHLYPTWEFLDNAIVIDGIKRYIGFSADQEANFQGYHSFPDKPLFIIVDEAAGIPEQIFRAIDRCNPKYYLITGSPLNPEGEFYKVETKPDSAKYFKHYQMTQFECPWIKKEDIQRMIDSWGNDHPLVLSSIYGEFAMDSENAIISLASLNKCLNNPPSSSVMATSDIHVGIDYAAGGDSNAVVMNWGNKVDIIKVWKERDTMTAAGQVKNILDDLKLNYGIRPSQVSGDASGLGLPICDRLRELGWPINRFYGQSKPWDEEHYKNRISEIWLEGARKIVNCQVILPKNDDLRMELLSRKQRLNSSGKMELETKEEMRERGIHSPDISDAMFLAMSKCHKEGEVIAKAVPRTGKPLSIARMM